LGLYPRECKSFIESCRSARQDADFIGNASNCELFANSFVPFTTITGETRDNAHWPDFGEQTAQAYDIA
jgi:hypothetical protein